MSLRGRYVIDRIKRSITSKLNWKLPVPPYQNPAYWEGVYRSLGPDDVYEWGNINYNDIKQYQYKSLSVPYILDENYEDGTNQNDNDTLTTTTTTLVETLGLSCGTNEQHEYRENEEPIVILGCGNSKFGEDMLVDNNNSDQNNRTKIRGPIIQVDVASRVVQSMSHRCNRYIQTGDMIVVQDDATVLSAFEDSKVYAVFDKGLLDALYCSDEYDQCRQVLLSMQRVLKPGGIVSFLSFTRPEFWIRPSPKTKQLASTLLQPKLWSDIQIRQLDTILLYRLQKVSPDVKLLQQQQKRKKHHGGRGSGGGTSSGKRRTTNN